MSYVNVLSMSYKTFPSFLFSPNKSDFIRAKYQFLSFVNKHKDSDVSSIDDVSKVRVKF